MRYVIVGEDKRFDYVCDRLRRDKKQVQRCYHLDELESACTKSATVLVPFGLGPGEQAQVLKSVSKGGVVVGGKLHPENTVLVAKAKLVYRDLASRDDFARRNALPTAEGCLMRILTLTPFVLSGTSVLVCGFGRVGAHCARLLRRCGADVFVLGREGNSLDQAREANFPVLGLPQMNASLPFRVIVNTVPVAGFLSACFLSACPHLFLVLDLASGKNNVDEKYLYERGILFESALGLPGKCAPETAAEYVYQFLCES